MRTKTLQKSKPKEESEFIETDFGDRKVSHINQSRMIALPKMALQNACGTADDLTMSVSLIQKGNEKFKGNNLYDIKFERKKINRFLI